jgi:hypothetical protein
VAACTTIFREVKEEGSGDVEIMFKCEIFINLKKDKCYFLPRVPVVGDILVIPLKDSVRDCEVIKVRIYSVSTYDSVVATVYCE